MIARRLPLAALLLALCALALPAAAAASPNQITIMQDDATLLGGNGHDVDGAFAQAKALGVDVVRLGISWYGVSPQPTSRRRPSGFDLSDPNSPGYRWGPIDGFVRAAARHDLKLLVTLAPPLPYWASEEPSRCPHRIGGYRNLSRSCMWKPRPALFGQFARAVARRYGRAAPAPLGGHVALYSMWNEPNLEHYLYPQLRRTRAGVVDVAAKTYRSLWYEGWKAVAARDPALRGRVLFGETAAISSPIDTLYAALCLDERGRPFRGRMRALQGCTRARRLPIGGLAVHPYNGDADGGVFTVSHTLDSLPLPYLSRASRLLNRAARAGRIPGGRGVYVTEFGFQSNPPDRLISLNLTRHAQALNEAERLFYGDPRVRSTAQYELYDVRDPDEFNTGLLRSDGRRKPAWAAFRMPLVVTTLSRDVVEVWGAVRPARGRATARVMVSSGRSFRVLTRLRTNGRGYFRRRVRLRGAARLRYRSEWRSPGGQLMRSRIARPGRRIRYLG